VAADETEGQDEQPPEQGSNRRLHGRDLGVDFTKRYIFVTFLN
jgi:hypothetical protein